MWQRSLLSPPPTSSLRNCKALWKVVWSQSLSLNNSALRQNCIAARNLKGKKRNFPLKVYRLPINEDPSEPVGPKVELRCFFFSVAALLRGAQVTNTANGYGSVITGTFYQRKSVGGRELPFTQPIGGNVRKYISHLSVSIGAARRPAPTIAIL